MAPSTATNPSQKPEWKVRPLTSLGSMLASVFMSSILPSVPLKARTAIFRRRRASLDGSLRVKDAWVSVPSPRGAES